MITGERRGISSASTLVSRGRGMRFSGILSIFNTAKSCLKGELILSPVLLEALGTPTIRKLLLPSDLKADGR